MKHKLLAIILIIPLMINLLVFSSAEIITAASTIRVTSVEVDAEVLEFDRIATTQRITATVMPFGATNRNVAFTSSNTDVAEVDENGFVTAISNGVAQITVTSEDGGHTARTVVNVNSFFIEMMTVSLSSDEIFEGDTSTISVTVSPRNAMLSLPMFENNASNMVMVTPFTELENHENTSEATFIATVTAKRVGIESDLARIDVLVYEAQTGASIRRPVFVNVLPREDDVLRFYFEGATYDENRPLITAATEVPLQVNRQDAQSLEFELTDTQTEIAEIVDVNGTPILIFSEAGTVELNFASGTGDNATTSTVEITSTFREISQIEVANALEGFQNMPLNFGHRKQIAFDIVPMDFERYYDVTWTSTSGIAIRQLSATNVIINAVLELPFQVVTINFSHNTDSSLNFSLSIFVTVEAIGVDDISITLDGHVAGFEQTYVFGNQTSNGQDFVYSMHFTLQGVIPNVTNLDLEFTLDSNLATVIQSGVSNVVLRFNSNFDFNGEDSAYVTITIRSVHASLNRNEYAEATYTFQVLNAANVANQEDFEEANNENIDIVLRRTIIFNIPDTHHDSPIFQISVSIFGNGYTMDAGAIADTINNTHITIFSFINPDNFTIGNETLITNVVFAGFGDGIDELPETGPTNSFNQLTSRGSLIAIGSNTTLQYSQLMRAGILLRIATAVDFYFPGWHTFPNENINVTNNHFRDAGFAAIFLGESEDRGWAHGTELPPVSRNIHFGNLIFEKSLMGIFFEPGISPNLSGPLASERNGNFGTFEFEITGFMKFHNWVPQRALDYIDLVIGEARMQMSSFDLNTVEYDGVELALLGIVIIDALLDAGQLDPSFAGVNIFAMEHRVRLGGTMTQKMGTPIVREPNPIAFGNATWDGSRPTNGSHFTAISSVGDPFAFSIFQLRPLMMIFNSSEHIDGNTDRPNNDFVGPADRNNPNLSLLHRQ